MLVVDDEDGIRSVIGMYLAEEGHEVIEATSGEDAIAALRTERPHLVILDMRMPGIDGWGVAHAIRKFAPEVPFILATAVHDGARQAQEIGADAYLLKPFALEDLGAAIDRLTA